MVGFKSLAAASLTALALAHPHHGGSLEGRASTVAFGVNIVECRDTSKVALTFDDGPAQWTDLLLTTLKADPTANHKVTFFVNGDNWSLVVDHKTTLQQMIQDGHQIGSHTYVNWQSSFQSSLHLLE
jgi:peptidoglycan/xylan/chitin deacetylase (PgdA/CDA1 family)